MRSASAFPRPIEWQGWWRDWLESFETGAATGAERIVAGEAFAELLVQVTENALALSRIAADGFDLALRNLRLAGRADIDHLARRIASSEDKLERLLQAVDRLRDHGEEPAER
jgi:hypothetical protein